MLPLTNFVPEQSGAFCIHYGEFLLIFCDLAKLHYSLHLYLPCIWDWLHSPSLPKSSASVLYAAKKMNSPLLSE